MRRTPILLALSLASCGTPPPTTTPSPPRGPVTISVVGTADLHGHLRALPFFAAHVRALRAERAAEGGDVLLVDAGDMWQGTLESNLVEGASVVAAYNALGYHAAAIGNHEFDYGPVGEAASPDGPGDDPRGALRARATEARFPFLSANLAQAGERPDWGPNVLPAVRLELSGVRIALIGVTAENTLRATLAANVTDLEVLDLADVIARATEAEREAGADVVVVLAHAGGHCDHDDDPLDLSSCRDDEEIFEVARALPAGSVDAIVGGHTHQRVAHVVNDIPIVQSYAYGRAYGRIDLTVDRDTRAVADARIFPTQAVCASGSVRDGDCALPAPLTLDAEMEAVIAPALARADARRAEPTGVTLENDVDRSYAEESPLGNLFADLMLAARPEADVALMNGGGLRASLPAGPLLYGSWYEALPFDNRFARFTISARHLRRILRDMLRTSRGFLDVAGVTVAATCEPGMRVALMDADGDEIPLDRSLSVVTSDYLATAAGTAIAERAAQGGLELESGPTVRDEMLRVLARDGVGEIRERRIRYAGRRPVRCGPEPD